MRISQSRHIFLFAAIAIAAVTACSSNETATQTPENTSTTVATSTATQGAGPTATVTATALPTSTPTASSTTTPTATAVPTPTTTPPAVATATAQPGPTPTRSPQPTATVTSTVLPTIALTPTPIPTFTPTPTQPVVPQPTPTPTVSVSFPPTATPIPTPDQRYSLIVTSDDARAYEIFESEYYLDYTSSVGDVPAGARKVLYIPSVNPVPVDQINETAANAPGSVWYVLGEPNAHGVAVEDVLLGLHDTYAAIKAADPTALITSPSILNYSFNCINCGGYLHGATWITNFYFEYRDLFGEPPPIDIWAIDVFPLVWPGPGLPASEAFPTVRDDIVVKQIEEYREWVDALSSERGKPIWITEFGLHWGFEDWEFGVPGCGNSPNPVGEYLADEVIAYLERTYTWLEANSAAMNIERWFTFATYKNIGACQADSGNGMSLLNGREASAEMTEVGEFYWNWVRGIR